MDITQFDQATIDQIKQLDPNIKITEAVNDDDAASSFKDEASYKDFIDRSVNGIQFSISQAEREEAISNLQSLLGDSYIVYFSEQNFGHKPDEITILKSADKYDALRFEGCNGVNHDIYTEDIITYLQELEKTNPFVLTGVGFDFTQGRFISPPQNTEELADSMYEFCPDIVDQGTQSVEGLIEELKNSNAFYFWWD